MLTGIITFVVIFAVIGSILYGRKLAKTEKLDAVFGNPERAKGGVHWVIVGSSFLLLTWLYYSWDIAKSFYPQSANELCQVGKVNDSLLSLKYLFPIEEREFKSTSIIKSENRNLTKLANEIKNSKISEQHRSILIRLIEKTKSTIPLLTNENLLDNQTKIKISELADKIDQLSIEFQKKDYPYETSEQRNKRLQNAQTEGGWGASSTSLDNKVEIPTIPKTDKGLKFDAAAQKLKLISDEFFKLRNHNFKFKSAIKKIKSDIKIFRQEANDNEEIASTLAKDILKIVRRIEYASIFPPTTLDEMQKSILTFDKVQ